MKKYFDKYGEEVEVFDEDGGKMVDRESMRVGPIDIKALMDAGLASGKITSIPESSLLYSIVPEGATLTKMDLSKTIDDIEDRRKVRETGRPLRHTGDFVVADVDSFVAMIKREKIDNTTIITANMDNSQFVGIVNYAENGQVAGHGDRRIMLTLNYTTEFGRWMKANRQRLTQLQLADFLEENLENIIEPLGAEMIEMIQSLKVKRNATYTSVMDTNTGAQAIAYKEDVKGEMQNGAMEFKGKFKIALKPFVGTKNPYEIECNLRFSVESDRLTVFFSMINIEVIKEHAFDAEVCKVREAMVDLEVPVFNIT